eukprot:g80070.t1
MDPVQNYNATEISERCRKERDCPLRTNNEAMPSSSSQNCKKGFYVELEFDSRVYVSRTGLCRWRWKRLLRAETTLKRWRPWCLCTSLFFLLVPSTLSTNSCGTLTVRVRTVSVEKSEG